MNPPELAELPESPPKLGLNPPELAELLESPPKLGLNSDDVVVVVLLLADADGVKPKLGAGAAFEGSALGFSVSFGAKRFVGGAEGVEGLLLIALANMFDVAVAGGLSFGVEADG